MSLLSNIVQLKNNDNAIKTTDDIPEGPLNQFYSETKFDARLGNFMGIDESDNINLFSTTTINGATIPETNLVVAPEVLEINVNAEGTGQHIPWKWTWQESSLAYSRIVIDNITQPSVPLYEQGTYTLNNFAAIELHSGLTQTHDIKLKWIQQAGDENNISWAVDQGTVSHSNPAINGGTSTQVNRQLVTVPSFPITPPALTAPTSTVYTVTFDGGNFNYNFDGARKGLAPSLGPWYRGGTYTININAVGHPLYFTTDNGANFSSGTYFGEYTNGVTGSRTDNGTITITVPNDAPDTLFYQCGNHAGMKGTITIKDLAVDVNENGNFIVYAQHDQEGMVTPVELRPIPALASQMCIVYDSTTGKFVPQDLETYIERTPRFKNKIKEVAGTATLVVEEGAPVVSTVTVVQDNSYLPYTNNNIGDLAYDNANNRIFVWSGTEWEVAETDLTNYYTKTEVDTAVGAKANTASLSTVATTGSYTDLLNQPTLFDGAYSSLTGAPTTVSSFTNDSGYLTAHQSLAGYATETYVNTAVSNLVDTAPATLDTLNELAAALGDDPNFATTISTSIGTKLSTADFTSTADTWLGTKSTTNVAEGTNLYYTDARVDTHLNTGTATAGKVLSWSGSDYTWGNVEQVLIVEAGTPPVGSGADPNGNYNLLMSNLGQSAGNVTSYIFQDNGGIMFNPGTNQMQVSGTIVANQFYTLNYYSWEGSTQNDFQTFLYATDPTADRNIYLPDAGGTVALTSDIEPAIDTHLNTGTATTGQLLSWSGSDYTWSTLNVDSSVDTHLNTSTATTGQLLSWNGTDYAWSIPASGGDTVVFKTALYDANPNEIVVCDTTNGSFTVNLPSNPTNGDKVTIVDSWDFTQNPLTVLSAGNTIAGATYSMTLDRINISVVFYYNNGNWSVSIVGDIMQVKPLDSIGERSYMSFAPQTSGALLNTHVSEDVYWDHITDRLTFGTGISTAYTHMNFANTNGVIGSISTNGTTTAYNTTSDYRVKTDLKPIDNELLMNLRPVDFEWTTDGTRSMGFLAHELQSVIPDAVTGEKDAVDENGNQVLQGVDYSKVVPLLTSALQGALMKIEELEQRINILENK